MGVRRIGEENGRIYTPEYVLALENPCVIGMGVQGTKGAMVKKEGQIIPNTKANKSTPFEEEKFVDAEEG